MCVFPLENEMNISAKAKKNAREYSLTARRSLSLHFYFLHTIEPFLNFFLLRKNT